jgi:hypothetical protein
VLVRGPCWAGLDTANRTNPGIDSVPLRPPLSPPSSPSAGSSLSAGCRLVALSLAAAPVDVVEPLPQAFERRRLGSGHGVIENAQDEVWNPPFGQLDDQSLRSVEALAHAL